MQDSLRGCRAEWCIGEGCWQAVAVTLTTSAVERLHLVDLLSFFINTAEICAFFRCF
jgi:hypothetical protein